MCVGILLLIWPGENAGWKKVEPCREVFVLLVVVVCSVCVCGGILCQLWPGSMVVSVGMCTCHLCLITAKVQEKMQALDVGIC